MKNVLLATLFLFVTFFIIQCKPKCPAPFRNYKNEACVSFHHFRDNKTVEWPSLFTICGKISIKSSIMFPAQLGNDPIFQNWIFDSLNQTKDYLKDMFNANKAQKCLGFIYHQSAFRKIIEICPNGSTYTWKIQERHHFFKNMYGGYLCYINLPRISTSTIETKIINLITESYHPTTIFSYNSTVVFSSNLTNDSDEIYFVEAVKLINTTENYEIIEKQEKNRVGFLYFKMGTGTVFIACLCLMIIFIPILVLVISELVKVRKRYTVSASYVKDIE